MGLGLFDSNSNLDILLGQKASEEKNRLELLFKILEAPKKKIYTDENTRFMKNILEPFLEEMELSDKLKFLKILEKTIMKQKQLEQLNICENSKIIALGGGFSSGKSQFINSILGEEILPVNLNPSTSIPTFIGKIKNKKTIKCLNYSGREIIISEKELQSIVHSFELETGITLTRIIKILSIETDKLKRDGIFILDTPGYTKSDHYKKNDNTDSFIAKEHLMIADCLIWLVDIENGTIMESDLNFLRNLDFKGPIYFILNKADKVDENKILIIKEEVKNILTLKNIDFIDVIAYSSIEEKEYFSNNLGDIFSNKVSLPIPDEREFMDNFIIGIERYFENEIELKKEVNKKIGALFSNPGNLCTNYDFSVLESLYQNKYYQNKILSLRSQYEKVIKNELQKLIQKI